MAWETRGRGTRYYTRSRRVNGRVVRQYFGAGLIGELAAEMDADRRAELERKRHAWEAEREEFEAIDEQVKELDQACASLMRSVLEEAGYHQHKRGEWRKRRDGHNSNS